MQAGASQHSTISHPWGQWVLVGAEYSPLPSIMRCNEVGQYGVADILLPLCPSHQLKPSDLSPTPIQHQQGRVRWRNWD